MTSGIIVRRYDGQKVYFSLSMTTKTHLIKGKALLTIGYTIFGHTPIFIVKYHFTGSMKL